MHSKLKVTLGLRSTVYNIGTVQIIIYFSQSVNYQKVSNFNSGYRRDVDSCLHYECHSRQLFILFSDRYGVTLTNYRNLAILVCVKQLLEFVGI